MSKVITFLKSKLGKVVLGILALLATLTTTGFDDKAIQMLSSFVENTAVEQPALNLE